MKFVARLMIACFAALAATAPCWAARPAGRKALSISPDGDRVAVASPGRSTVSLLDGQGRPVAEIALDAPVAESAFSPDGKKLAVCLERGGLVIVEDGRVTERIPESAGACSELSWSPDGRRLFYLLVRTGTESPQAPDDTQEFKVWEAASRKLTTGHTARVERPDAKVKNETPPPPRSKGGAGKVPDARGNIPP